MSDSLFDPDPYTVAGLTPRHHRSAVVQHPQDTVPVVISDHWHLAVRSLPGIVHAGTKSKHPHNIGGYVTLCGRIAVALSFRPGDDAQGCARCASIGGGT